MSPAGGSIIPSFPISLVPLIPELHLGTFPDPAKLRFALTCPVPSPKKFR
jgi:hypothetical protein